MGKNYRTSHVGIAAYVKLKGFKVVDAIQGKNKKGYPTVIFEFDIDEVEGRELGDSFFDGQAYGSLREFHDSVYEIRQLAYDIKGKNKYSDAQG